MARIIGHIDLDYFYAQVEEVENPSIKGRPVVVCVFSGRTEESGVVSTSNYRARELGVSSGMPIAIAKKRLQRHDPVVIKMVHEKYEAVSSRIMDIVGQRVDILERTGIDEAFFDVTSSSNEDFRVAERIANDIKDAIMQRERLTSSVGLGRSKVVAKLASDAAKPGGLIVVLPNSTEAFLGPLPVSKLYGVGPKTAAALEEVGIRTVEELAKADPQDLELRVGRKFASFLVAAATGTDAEPVSANEGPTQLSRIVTLKRDTRDPEEAIAQIAEGITQIHKKLTASGKSFRTISAIGILTDLSMKTRSKTFDTPINDAKVIGESARLLIADLANSSGKDLRRVGVRVSELTDEEEQSSLSEFLQPTG